MGISSRRAFTIPWAWCHCSWFAYDEAPEKISLDAGLGKDHFCGPVYLGRRRVAAGIGVVGDLQPLAIEGIHSQDGAPTTEPVVTYIIQSFDLLDHLGDIAGPPEVSLLDPPGDLVQFRGRGGRLAGHIDAKFGMAKNRGIIDGDAAIPGD